MTDYRIEAATKEEWANRALVAEAKLTKAVEVLNAAKEYIDELEWCYGGGALATGNKYYAALAELEKRND